MGKTRGVPQFLIDVAGRGLGFEDRGGNPKALTYTEERADGSSEILSDGRKFSFGLSILAGAIKWFGAQVNSTTFNQTAGLGAVASTYGIKLEAEAEFDAVKLVWVNRAGNAVNNCSALVAATETAATDTQANISQPIIGGAAYGQIAPAGSIQGWRSVTWGGAAVANLPAAASAAQYAVSDWIPLSSLPRTDGGTRPLLMIRCQHDGAADGNFAFLATAAATLNRAPSTANRGRIVQLSSQTTGVSVPANSGGLSNASYEVFPIFRYRRPALSVMVAGDSTEQNDALLPSCLPSWGWRGCADASSLNRPVNFLNMGASGRTSTEYWARAQEIISAGVVPDVLVISPASVNDGYNNLDRTFETARARAVEILDFARQKGIKRVCFIPLLPYNANTAQQDGYRKAFNKYLATLASFTPGVAVLNFSGLGNGATPERWQTTMNNKGAWQWILFSTVKQATDVTGYVAGTTYTATVTVDGTACPISFVEADVATFGTLVSTLNDQINAGMGTVGVLYATLDSGNICIKSGTAGAGSTVVVTANTVFAAPLAGFSSVPGSLASSGSADGIHPNEKAVDTVMAPALTSYINSLIF